MHAAEAPVPREGQRKSATWGWRSDEGVHPLAEERLPVRA